MAALIDGANIPEFASEEQEALWWDEHKSQVERNLSAAMQNGTAQRRTAQRVSGGMRVHQRI